MKIELISSIKNAEFFCKAYFYDNSPFLKYSFFKLLEDSKCTNESSGWIPQHFIFKENNEIVAFVPNFKKLNSNGEYIFDHMFENAYYQIGSNYFPKYLSGIPFTPVTRLKFIYSKNSVDQDKVINLIIKVLKEKKISSFHANFIDSQTSKKLEKYKFFKRVGIQYHWVNNSFTDFNDFLNTMKSRKKKTIAKERKFLKDHGVSFISKEGEMINEEDIKNLYSCYLNTIEKKWSRPYLNFDFFNGLISSEREKKILLISAYKDKKLLGCSIHFVGNEILYGRYWGCTENIPYLHFELCYYQAIEYAIKNKLQKVEAGAQGEHKISRGYLPNFTYSNHWFNNESLSRPIQEFLEKENKKTFEVADYLSKFSPFSENSN